MNEVPRVRLVYQERRETSVLTSKLAALSLVSHNDCYICGLWAWLWNGMAPTGPTGKGLVPVWLIWFFPASSRTWPHLTVDCQSVALCCILRDPPHNYVLSCLNSCNGFVLFLLITATNCILLNLPFTLVAGFLISMSTHFHHFDKFWLFKQSQSFKNSVLLIVKLDCPIM